jgi:hypothetical protein
LFIVVLFCAKYKATIISTMGKLRFALVLLQKKVLSDNSDLKFTKTCRYNQGKYLLFYCIIDD